MSQGALIVGSGLAGIQAALDLARSGITVHLVESAPFLGVGEMEVVPHHVLNARLLEAAKHTNVTVWTNTRVNRAGADGGHFQIELRQHPRYVDVSRCTACNDCVEVCPVTVAGTGHKAIHLEAGAQPGCAVIDKLGKAPCSNTCPGGIHVQGYIALVAQGRFAEALALIRQAIPFPGICGRICTHPCELNCRRTEVDEAVSIRLLKRFLADWEIEQFQAGQLEDVVEPVSIAAGAQRVAVIGAGPAGLAVADNLVRKGYRVTVFEAQPVVGGMMAMGIPAYRLPREVIRREVARIERVGVEIRLNTPVGPDGQYTLDDLFAQGYDAIFLGVGAHGSHALRIPGEDLVGVVSGIDLLKAINLSNQTGDPRWQMKVLSYLLGGVATRVAIVGGGNTAMDVARSLKRVGVDDVRILYRRTRAEMPALPEEIDEAEREGIPIEFLVSPVRILGNDQGRVVALECVRMKLGEPDPSGRRRPVPIAGSEFVLDLDVVVPAIGQSPDISFLGAGHPFAITREGTFNVDRVSYMTNRPGVFAAGDAITQAVSVIDAIGSAKQAASGIHAYLQGLPFEEIAVSAREVPISRRPLLPEELTVKPRHASPTISMARRMHSHTEVETGYDAATAIAEAQRCLACGPCSECLACEAVCKPQAIVHGEQERYASVEVEAVVWASGEEAPGILAAGAVARDGDDREFGQVYRINPGDPIAGSAAAARVMMQLSAGRRPAAASVTRPGRAPEPAPAIAAAPRIGVFVCQCNGEISDVVDTYTLQHRAVTWPAVVHTGVLDQACATESAEAIYQAISDHGLNRVVLAACSCCAVDQVCYSCTYQRIRCKENLLGKRFSRDVALFEFVNIREDCAWIHDGDSNAATASASAMVAAAVASARLAVANASIAPARERTALVVGNGPAAAICQGALTAQGIRTVPVGTIPDAIRQTPGHFTVSQGSSALWHGSAVILAPENEDELHHIWAAFGPEGRRPRRRDDWRREVPGSTAPAASAAAGPRASRSGHRDRSVATTHRPGVYVCDPNDDPDTMGLAAAARAAAWLGNESVWPSIRPATVDVDRCRGCGDCELVCEFGAIQLQVDPAQGEAAVAWVDASICQGCGICAVHCPAGAIQAGHVTNAQLEAMLEAILA